MTEDTWLEWCLAMLRGEVPEEHILAVGGRDMTHEESLAAIRGEEPPEPPEKVDPVEQTKARLDGYARAFPAGSIVEHRRRRGHRAVVTGPPRVAKLSPPAPVSRPWDVRTPYVFPVRYLDDRSDPDGGIWVDDIVLIQKAPDVDS